jgi:hypothetical protein
MQGKFSEFRGDGRYTVSVTMFMPVGAGKSTLQFEAFTNPPANLQAFMHLDFTEDNEVRIDDNANTDFGSFARGQPPRIRGAEQQEAAFKEKRTAGRCKSLGSRAFGTCLCVFRAGCIP